jgi:hypothetical protein
MTLLIDFRAADGSRQFLEILKTVYPEELVVWLETLPGLKITEVLSSIPETWVDFTYRGYAFSVHDPIDAYWFFVADPDCADVILQEVADHVARRLL